MSRIFLYRGLILMQNKQRGETVRMQYEFIFKNENVRQKQSGCG